MMYNECLKNQDSNCQYIVPEINIESVTDDTILYWAFLYWIDELDCFEEALEEAKDKEQIEYLCNSIVEANVILLELYNKLVAIPEFDIRQFANVEWLNRFWN